MLQSPHSQFALRASHNFTNIGQGVPQFFPGRSQPLSARSQASIISGQPMGAADASQLMAERYKAQEDLLRQTQLQLKEKDN